MEIVGVIALVVQEKIQELLKNCYFTSLSKWTKLWIKRDLTWQYRKELIVEKRIANNSAQNH